MDELTLDDKIYISSKRAAAITGYAKDYVGQLCREGRVEARLVGRSWYVLEDSIRSHRFGVVKSEEEISDENLKDTKVLTQEVDNEKPKENEVIFEHRYFQEEITPIKEVEQDAFVAQKEDDNQIVAMQDAWKEWFDGKKQASNTIENSIEENNPYSLAYSEENHKEVPLHIIRDTEQSPQPEVDNITPVVREQIRNDLINDQVNQTLEHNGAVSVDIEQQPIRSYVLLKAILVAIVVIVVSITMISTGIVQTAGLKTSGFFIILSGETEI